MIRAFKKEDIDEVMDIWLNTNIEAHAFISADYWKENYSIVKTMLPNASIYVYEVGNQIVGFIGIVDDYIEGIFISKEYQSQGIGKQFIHYVKQLHTNLSLKVYKKNIRGIDFYKREQFEIVEEQIDDQTKEKELLMRWSR